MARPRKPTLLKIANGSARHDSGRINSDEPIPTRGIGPAPDRFGPELRGAWDEIVGICYPGVLGEGDRIVLEMLVILLVEFRSNPAEFNGARIQALVSMLGRLGMSPADRSKIGVPKPQKQNPFSEL